MGALVWHRPANLDGLLRLDQPRLPMGEGMLFLGQLDANMVALENGDAVWVFSLKGQLGPLWPPPPPQSVAGPAGPVADGVNTIKIGDNNVEYAYWPGRTRVKAETAVTFTNVGDVPRTATAFEKGKWGPVQDRHLLGVRQLLLHLRAAPLDVRAGHRRIDPKAENARAVACNE